MSDTSDPPGAPDASQSHREPLTYKDAGVDLTAGEDAVRRIKRHVVSTYRPEVIGDVAGFGSMFEFDRDRYRHPVLVSATDGVGTKALVAGMAGRFDSIGLDLVAMSVDDIVCTGAEPLFFLYYVAVGRLDPAAVEVLVEGIAKGCRDAGCALIGGELSEQPGAMGPGQFDLVGTAVGVVERNRIIDGTRATAGDVLIGLPSPGLRSNGYSLARKVFFDVAARSLEDPPWPGATRTLGDELLEPSIIYSRAVADLVRKVDVHALAHVKGGGIVANLPRALHGGVDAVLRRSAWTRPPVFDEIQRLGEIDDAEMANVFNLGLGMVIAVKRANVFRALDVLRAHHRGAVEVGELVDGTGRVHLAP